MSPDVLLARFGSRLRLEDLPVARARLEALMERTAREPDAVAVGRASVVLADLLAAAPLRWDAASDSPSSTIGERAERVRRRRLAELPPEIVDGAPPSWSNDIVSREAVRDLWRARSDAGPRPGERWHGYVHVPFCRTRCAFCQFESIVDTRPDTHEALLRSIAEEAAALAEVVGLAPADAVTIGGGTPSELTADELTRLLAILEPLFQLRRARYVSVEVNPDTATRDRIAALGEGGVTRISMGVQSLDPTALHAVARGYQDRAMVEEAVRAARDVGIALLGLDLLAPLPHETETSFREGARTCLALGPDELVLYRYQPVLRGRERTIAPGALPFEVARAIFEDEVRLAGYELAAHTGSSRIARRPGTLVPAVRYVQHPREPTSILGLGPFAESHVLGHGRYVALADGRYRLMRTTLELERSTLTTRRLAAELSIDERALEGATGRTLADWRGEALGRGAELGALHLGEAQVTPGPRLRELRDEVAFHWVARETLHGLAPRAERIDETWGARLGPLIDRLRVARGRVTARGVEGIIRFDDLLFEADARALAALFEPVLGDRERAGALARGVLDGLLEHEALLSRWGAASEELTLERRGSSSDAIDALLAVLAPSHAPSPWNELVIRGGDVSTRTPMKADALPLASLAARVDARTLPDVDALLETSSIGVTLRLRARGREGEGTLGRLGDALSIAARPRPAEPLLEIVIPCGRTGSRVRLDVRAATLHHGPRNTVRRRLPIT